MKKILNFLKTELIKAKPIFAAMLFMMTNHLQQINAIGWGGWSLYGATFLLTIVSFSLSGGFTLKDIYVENTHEIIKDLVKTIINTLIKKRTPSNHRKGRKARKSKGAKP
ncbi:hypothetical protein [Acidithiobacillus thiooxidans]|uniref:hypothetical protein n=1 Tax=Acidithiobacillus thiooxidans TaxID=930 RepID=UPI0004E14F2C|nr:hypothetical protein [Acidithiobacillus thiooxidans]